MDANTKIRLPKLPVINGLRGLAILLVIYHHVIVPPLTAYLAHLHTLRVSGLSVPASELFFKQGWMGVNLFFILSGFVLYLPYYLGARTMQSRADVVDFYKRRAARLMPLFFINCFVCAFVAMRYQPFWFESFLPAVTTLSMFTDYQWMPTINPALWSLMIEIYFALICPFLFMAIGRIGWRKATVAIFVLAWIVRMAGAMTNHLSIQDSLPARLDDFVLGMILCRVYFERRMPKAGAKLLLTVSIASLAGATVLCDLWKNGSGLSPYVIPFIGNLIQVGFFSLSLGALRSQRALRTLFTNRALQLLGMMCYSIYMWHLVMLQPLTDGWITHPPRLLIYSVYLLIFSALSYRYIEFGSEKNWRKLFSPPFSLTTDELAELEARSKPAEQTAKSNAASLIS
ncbi:MAG TPA: acyltransferase [Planktothrix sp.]|jgi:peptidoglycan/LPS O-acetylase OafA/YrhL